MTQTFKNDIQRWRSNLAAERDALSLYLVLARFEKDPARAAIWRVLAGFEERHAERWIGKLRAAGETVRDDWNPGWRPRTLGLLARVMGPGSVLPILSTLEKGDADMYVGQHDAHDLIEEEEQMGRMVAALADGQSAEAVMREVEAEQDGAGGQIGRPAHDRRAQADALTPAVGAAPFGGTTHSAASSPAGADSAGRQKDDLVKRETWHKAATANSGTLRAAIFGINDGLVSNLSLVMGVSAAAPGSQFVLLAGIAGLLAGSFSMAAGEYVSMQSQRELFERQIALERDELEENPEDELQELSLIYQAKGIPRADAERVARNLMEDKEVALDTLVREELGLDPDELGSPWGAATSSFTAFSVGALIPVLPYLFAGGLAAFVASAVLSAIALFAVGAGVSLLTGRGLLFSGARMLAIGAIASAVTYLVGALIGVSIAG